MVTIPIDRFDISSDMPLVQTFKTARPSNTGFVKCSTGFRPVAKYISGIKQPKTMPLTVARTAPSNSSFKTIISRTSKKDI